MRWPYGHMDCMSNDIVICSHLKDILEDRRSRTALLTIQNRQNKDKHKVIHNILAVVTHSQIEMDVPVHLFYFYLCNHPLGID